MYFDPGYLLFALPAMLLALWAQSRVKLAYGEAGRIPSSSGISGAQAAGLILAAAGVRGVQIEQTSGTLSDHYDPKSKTLRLSSDVYSGTSLAAVGIAAHEVGHALQDAEKYPLLVIRNGIVPLASVGGNLSMFVIMIGFMINSFNLLMAGIALFSTIVVFQLVNLPVEFDASARAKRLIVERGLIAPQELAPVEHMLSAAAMTYVAATLSAVMTLVYYLWRAGVFSRRDD
jgi:Zn-dependent membrane protease YugP